MLNHLFWYTAIELQCKHKIGLSLYVLDDRSIMDYQKQLPEKNDIANRPDIHPFKH